MEYAVAEAVRMGEKVGLAGWEAGGCRGEIGFYSKSGTGTRTDLPRYGMPSLYKRRSRRTCFLRRGSGSWGITRAAAQRLGHRSEHWGKTLFSPHNSVDIQLTAAAYMGPRKSLRCWCS